jgi:N6-adenosine-specific RNA methylase IME4
MKYGVIYADPPWPEHAAKGTPRHSSADRHFGTMSAKDILALPVESVAADSCVLFLWSTWRHLPLAVECVERWGFRWVTVGFVWLKTQNDGVTPKFGTGSYTRGSTEPCIIAARGSGTLPEVKNVRQVVSTIPGRLAEKPLDVRSEIERMYPDRNKLELFARKKVDGWTCSGEEVDGMDASLSILRLARRP